MNFRYLAIALPLILTACFSGGGNQNYDAPGSVDIERLVENGAEVYQYSDFYAVSNIQTSELYLMSKINNSAYPSYFKLVFNDDGNNIAVDLYGMALGNRAATDAWLARLERNMDRFKQQYKDKKYGIVSKPSYKRGYRR